MRPPDLFRFAAFGGELRDIGANILGFYGVVIATFDGVDPSSNFFDQTLLLHFRVHTLIVPYK